MTRRLLDFDRDTRTATYHHYDHETRVTRIETVQDVEPYLRTARAHRNRGVGGAGRLTEVDRKEIADGWWRVATIPAVIQHKWLLEYGVNVHNPDHKGRVHKLLDSPEWSYLKTTDGKIGRYTDGR